MASVADSFCNPEIAAHAMLDLHDPLHTQHDSAGDIAMLDAKNQHKIPQLLACVSLHPQNVAPQHEPFESNLAHQSTTHASLYTRINALEQYTTDVLTTYPGTQWLLSAN
jgi:hypothetical protein